MGTKDEEFKKGQRVPLCLRSAILLNEVILIMERGAGWKRRGILAWDAKIEVSR